MSEPPEAAVLQGLAMAGLVGILRQLGDLAELAADVFQDLQDQVMDVSARGRRLAARAKQLEDDLNPLIDQQDFLAAAPPNTERLSWHAHPKLSHGVVAAGSMPYFIAECIKQCRGPPGLSILDKYDADGEGACLRRYTNPSFFRANSRQQDTGRAGNRISDARKIDQSFRSETDPSGNASPRFLSMLRLLKHRQTRGSFFSSLKPQLQQNIQKYHHSEVDISFTSSPDLNVALDTSTATEKANENHQGNVKYQDLYRSDAGSDYGEQQGSELGRSSSFEAWLSPDSRTPEHDVIEESCRDTCNKSHGTIPPMQWLSVKVHTGTIALHNKPLEGKILKTSEFANLLLHSDEPWSESACTGPQPVAETRLRQEPRRQNFKFNLDTDHHMQVPERPTEKLLEDHENFDCMGADNSAGHGGTVSTSEAQVDAVQNSLACQSSQGWGGELQNESAVQELWKIPPPSVPRPKNSLLQVGSHGRYELRNGPGPIYPSRNLLDKKSEELLEQIKDKPLNVKPIHGSTSSNVMGSPTNSRVATILQRADDIRQVHAEDNNTDSEDGWSDAV